MNGTTLVRLNAVISIKFYTKKNNPGINYYFEETVGFTPTAAGVNTVE